MPASPQPLLPYIAVFSTGCYPALLSSHAPVQHLCDLNASAFVLQEVGVKLDKHAAIKIDEYSRTSVDNIWSIGDVTMRMALTPVAIMEGMAFAATCFGNKPTAPVHEKVSALTLPAVLPRQ